jgi:hypothetical protein
MKSELAAVVMIITYIIAPVITLMIAYFLISAAVRRGINTSLLVAKQVAAPAPVTAKAKPRPVSAEMAALHSKVKVLDHR